MTASELARSLRARRYGKGKWMAKCPVHHEKSASLSIRDMGNRIAICCFGCGANGVAVMKALGLKSSDLFYDADRRYDPEVQRQIREVEARREAEKDERTKLLWKARYRLQFWHCKSQTLGRSLMNYPTNDSLANAFNHALAMERRCRKIWETL